MPFQKGKSGNPKGRPRRKIASAERLRAAIEKQMPAIIEACVNAALEGDTSAQRLLIERVVPALKPQTPSLPVSSKDSLYDQGQAIITAMAAGILPPETAKGMLESLLIQSKIIEHADFDERLKRLEAQQ